ncbi:MAG: ABC transporter substrate-binding protein [Alphaproteobacteria bacterium]
MSGIDIFKLKNIIFILCIILVNTPKLLWAGPNVLFINPGRSGEIFWEMVSEFMKAAAKDLDINLTILSAERDHLLMAKLARNAATAKPPPDYMLLVNEKRAAAKLLPELPQTIKVILLNNGLSKDEKKRYGNPREQFPNWLATIVPDHKKAGRDIMRTLNTKAVQASDSKLERKVGLLAIGGNKVTLASQMRIEGMLDVLSKNSSTDLYQIVYSEWRQDKAEAQIYGLLRRWPATQLIWAANDPMALGALAAAERRNYRPGENIHIGGLNWSKEALKKIKTGKLSVSVGGHFMLGGWALVMIHDLHNGQDFVDLGHEITIPMSIITHKNVSSYLEKFGDENWGKINFQKFSRKNKKIKSKYNFSISNLLSTIKN